ncbi:hypothetical protein N3K66_004757 [Trichothecium roseum]|uniref:Uncharacterized protein n=1 Tax=Trichothecium roseum TaxID=47278 RepID=A0ACC0V273_9HYPO|nr:hypothetical protein N3K66_004757 [Trichothecium roseum]
MPFPTYEGVTVFRLPPEGFAADFAHPRQHRNVEHYTIVGVGIPLASIALCQRFYTKIFLSRGLQLDDFFMFLGWACSLVTQINMTVSVSENGLCSHSWEMPLTVFERYSLLSYVAAPIYQMCNGFVKLSLLTFYLNLPSPSRRFRLSIWLTMAFVTLYTVVISLLMWFVCNPPRKQFDLSIEGGRCMDAGILYIATAVSNIFTDVVLFVLPIPMVLELRLPTAQKLGAVLVFAVGSITIVFSIMRLTKLPPVLKSDDPTWAVCDANIWTLLEANFFVICGSMPTLRKFFKHFAPRLMGSSPSTKRPGPSPHEGGSALDRIRRQRRYAHFDDDDDDYDYGTGVGSSNSKSRSGQGIDVSSELQDFARPSRDARTGRTARIDAAPPLPSLVGTGAGAGAGAGSGGGSGSRSANRDDHSEKAILQTRTFTVQYDDD